MLNEVQHKIYRKVILNPDETQRLFQSPATPEFNLTIYRGLQRKVIDPDVAILHAISCSTTQDYIISIALCLRFGADANMYVETPHLGTLHILGYVYNSTNDTILNTIILMFLAKGSLPSLPMFYNKESEVFSGPSVTEWLNSQGYILNRITSASELNINIDVDSMAILSLLLDMPSLMSRNYSSDDMTLAIYALVPIRSIKSLLHNLKYLLISSLSKIQSFISTQMLMTHC